MAEPQREFRSAKEWRKWLASNHSKARVLWVVFSKKAKKGTTLSYAEALEEALCYGWIDSIIKRIDDEKYRQKFTPRANTQNWSERNIGIVRKLIAEGRMTKYGRVKISDEILNRKAAQTTPPELDAEIERLFRANEKAWNNFTDLAPSYRKQYVGWIQSAKKSETRLKRAKEALASLEKGRKLGMK